MLGVNRLHCWSHRLHRLLMGSNCDAITDKGCKRTVAQRMDKIRPLFKNGLSEYRGLKNITAPSINEQSIDLGVGNTDHNRQKFARNREGANGPAL